jgi:hypothetical protein
MEELGPFLLTLSQKADHLDVNNRDVFQIKEHVVAAGFHIVRNFAEMFRAHAPDDANGGSFSI